MALAAACIFFFASLWKEAGAAAFLTTRPHLNREDVKRLLLAELSGHAGLQRVHSIQDEMRPMFAALPKSEVGRLEPPTVRYALHRYFVAKHGWYVKGLDTAAWTAPATSTVLKARAPAFIQSLFDEHMHGRGLGLHELAVFAATLEDLIHAEATGQLEWIYQALSLPFVEAMPDEEASLAMEYFLVATLDFGSLVASNASELASMKARVVKALPSWNDTRLWMDDLRQTYDLQQLSRHNPFIEHVASFDESLSFAFELGHRFGSFQDLECQTLKSKLVDLEHFGTGRVLLSTFYSRALAGDWQFFESVEYLRNQGALDETDPDRPSVMIPNYMNSPANCLTASDFYAICCSNECEDLMGHLERRMAAPQAKVAAIAEVVSSLRSDTVDAPRNLSTALLSRLDEIAHAHDGLIPLHGRLFAQWMHHAYPRECSFPYMSGTTNPLSQYDFMAKNGVKALQVSKEVILAHASRANLTFEGPEALPWTSDEELVAEDKENTHSLRGRAWACGQALAALAALASFARPLMRSYEDNTKKDKASKLEQHFV